MVPAAALGSFLNTTNMSSSLLEEPRSARACTPLDRPLALADRALQQERGAAALFRSWPWVCGFIVAVLFADVVLHLSPHWRVGVIAGFSVLMTVLCSRAAWIAWGRRNAPEYTARILESRDPALGSKLINLLQLQAQTADPELSPITRDLARMAIDSYAADLEPANLPALARTDRARHEARRCGLGFLVLVVLLGLGFNVTRVEAPRFLDPFGDHPPFSFTRIEISDPGDDSTQVVYGGSLLVSVKTRGHRPRELFLSYHPSSAPEQMLTVPMFDKGDHGFTQQIEGIRSDLVLVAHTKNRHSLSRQRFIGVILTPKLEQGTAKITPPAYTALPPDERSLRLKTLKALAGSTIEFRLTSNRPLREGSIEIIKSPEEVEAAVLSPSGEHEVMGQITASASARLRFSVIDRDGHASQENWEAALAVTHDLGPDVQITNPNGDAFVAMDFKVDVIAEANDDYGIQTLRLHQAINGEYGEPRIISSEMVQRHVRDSYMLDISQMNLESGSTITLFAEAIDNAPEPRLARSKSVTLTVITVEEYNAFLRQQTDVSDVQGKYADLIRELHDLIEDQKKLGEQAAAQEDALEKATDPKAEAAAQQQLDRLLARQNEVNQKLHKLAGSMEEFVRKDPLYDIESELQETLRDKAQKIRETTAANDKTSQEIAEQRSGAEGATPVMADLMAEFKRASQRQAAKLGAVEKEAREEVLKPLEDMSLMQEIMKSLNRIQELSQAQQQLAEQTKAYDRKGVLSREDQLALKDLAATQSAIGAALEEVEAKLWEDGQMARQKFPKAAQSAADISSALKDMRLPPLAAQGTEAMLAGRGDQGAQIAARIRDELEKLFGQCESQGGGMSSELDQYLRINRGMDPASNFQQMMQCRKFGSGNKPGSGFGMGQGSFGKGGYAVISGQNPRVMGNETSISSGGKQPGTQGRSQQAPIIERPEVSVEKPDVVKDVNALNRESDAIQGETTIEQYSDLVEKYFNAITK